MVAVALSTTLVPFSSDFLCFYLVLSRSCNLLFYSVNLIRFNFLGSQKLKNSAKVVCCCFLWWFVSYSVHILSKEKYYETWLFLLNLHVLKEKWREIFSRFPVLNNANFRARLLNSETPPPFEATKFVHVLRTKMSSGYVSSLVLASVFLKKIKFCTPTTILWLILRLRICAYNKPLQ